MDYAVGVSNRIETKQSMKRIKKSMNRLKYLMVVTFLIAIALLLLLSCQKKDSRQADKKKLIVVTTLFPLYDFSKNIGGKYAEVLLLLPPGVEPHSFEPKPEDILRINSANLFVYTGKHMEPWSEKILKGLDNQSVLVIDTSKGITMIEDKGHSHEHSHGHAHEIDPHIWLDFENAKKMVDQILDGFIKADPEHTDAYRKNAENYKSALTELDGRFKKELASCKTSYFIHGGHYAFGYLAKRYGLNYISAYHGFSPNTEPSAKRLSELIKKMKQHQTNYVFYEELISPKVAEVLSKETGAELLKLHAAHNLTKDEFTKGVTFLELMEGNLANLKKGLQCR